MLILGSVILSDIANISDTFRKFFKFFLWDYFKAQYIRQPTLVWKYPGIKFC